MAVEVRWRVSRWATSLHAAEAMSHQRREIAAPLEAALQEPLAALEKELEAAALPADRFWRYLVPLGAECDGGRQLAETVLRKLAGTSCSSEMLLAALTRILIQLEGALRRQLPDLLETLPAQSEPLRQRWEMSGPNLLQRAGLLTDERAIVGQATVDLVYPALGGGGVAQLDYNSVRLEVLESEPDLPEVVRLAWLLAQLNIDLPVFSEQIPSQRLEAVAAGAMLPVVLHAAREQELVPEDSQLLERAIANWYRPGTAASQIAEILTSWWESYLEMRPAWTVALRALDEMLQGLSY